MEDNSLKEKTAKGLLWGGFSNSLFQILSALFGIALLHYLTPDDYGKVAVLVVFSNIAGHLQESGFIVALCNRKGIVHKEYNSVFWLSLFVSVALYIVLFFCAPFIADFYHEPILCPLARYLFLGFFISSFGIVQSAYLLKNMMAKQNGLISLTALILSNSLGIVLAMNGFAYWGIVTQSITSVLLIVLMKWYISPWRPTFNIDFRPAFSMFGFSSKLLLTNLFNQLNSQVFSILLGKFYNSGIVGYYSNARKWTDMASGMVTGMFSSIAQPALVEAGDKERVCRVFRKLLRFICFISFPCMFGLSIVSKEFILITVGEVWSRSADYLSILCIYGAFLPIVNLYTTLVVSRGKSNLNMISTIGQAIIIWSGLILLKSYGVQIMVYFFVTVNVLWILLWQYFANKLVGLKFTDVLKDIMPFLIITIVLFKIVVYLTLSIDNVYLSFLTKVLLAAVLYVSSVYLSGAKIMRESVEFIRKRF